MVVFDEIQVHEALVQFDLLVAPPVPFLVQQTGHGGFHLSMAALNERVEAKAHAHHLQMVLGLVRLHQPLAEVRSPLLFAGVRVAVPRDKNGPNVPHDAFFRVLKLLDVLDLPPLEPLLEDAHQHHEGRVLDGIVVHVSVLGLILADRVDVYFGVGFSVKFFLFSHCSA